MEEIWIYIDGYGTDYKVSNQGRVKSMKYRNSNKESLLAQCKDGKGYMSVRLFKNGKGKRVKVHRLVAGAFIKNDLKLPIVNHKDELKDNNYMENLEWCTNKYNVNYGTATERAGIKRSEIQEKKVYQYSLDGELIAIWKSVKSCSKKGFNSSAISACCRKDKWHKSHKGYLWFYDKL